MSSSKKKQLRKEQYMTERQAAAAKEAKKLKSYTLTFWVVIALVLCVFVSAVTINPIKNIIYKNTNAMKVGDHVLTSVDVIYFYIDAVSSYVSQNSAYLQYIMDINKPLNEQVANSETGATWADNFLDQAKESIKSTYALYDMAMKEGHKLTEDEQKNVDNTIATRTLYAAYYGYNSLDAWLRATYGNGAGETSYRNYLEISALASSYLTAHSDSLEFSADDLLDFQAETPYRYNSYTYASYYLSAASFREGGTKDDKGNTIYTDEEKAAAIKAAEEAANTLAAGTYADLEAFDAAIKLLPINKNNVSAASTKNEDKLYDEITSTFQDWMVGKVEAETEDADPTFVTRQEGDITVIKSSSGSGETEVINGYYVIRYGSVNTNEFAMKNIRHILVKFEGGKTDSSTGVTTYSAEEKAKAEAEAEKLLAEWEKGDKSENSFAELAKKESDDNKDAGGLYEDVYPGQMVDSFNDWCFDEARQVGDYGIVETEYGFHLMFFVGDSDTTFRDFMITNVLRSETMEKWHDGLVDAMTLEVLTTKHVDLDMVLGN